MAMPSRTYKSGSTFSVKCGYKFVFSSYDLRSRRDRSSHDFYTLRPFHTVTNQAHHANAHILKTAYKFYAQSNPLNIVLIFNGLTGQQSALETV